MTRRLLDYGTTLALAVIALDVVPQLIKRSGDPHAYFESTFQPTLEWHYPVKDVGVSCALMAMEALVFWLLMCRSPLPHLWRRALLCLTVTGPIFVGIAPLIVDSAPYFGFHVMWLGWLALLALVTFALAAITRLITWHLSRNA